MLIGNKTDLNDQQTVTIFVRDGRSFARKNGLMFIEMSALNSTGVDTAFQRILQETYKNTNQKVQNIQNQRVGTSSTGGGGGTTAITLTATAQMQGKTRYANLNWANATTTNVDIYRNGVKIITTANDGSHRDSPTVKGTFSYKVCNAASTTACCSPGSRCRPATSACSSSPTGMR